MMTRHLPPLTRTLVVVVTAALVGCATQETEAESTTPSATEVDDADENPGQWVELAPQFTVKDDISTCEPTGAMTEIRGEIEIEDFGKGTDGVRLLEGDKAWVISYNAQLGGLEEFEDETVVARGRPCDKQYESLSGPHFDVKALRAVSE